MNERSLVLRSEELKAKAAKLIGSLPVAEPPWEIVIRPYKSRRSSEQNKRYWALVHEVSEQVKPKDQEYSPDTWHEYFKRRFLGTVALPNGKEMGVSTAGLDVHAFADFLSEVEAWAAQRGVICDIQE